MQDDPYILLIPNVFSNDLCDELITFFCKNQERANETKYGYGENTRTFKISMRRTPNFYEEDIYKDVIELIESLLRDTIVNEIAPRFGGKGVWNIIQEDFKKHCMFSGLQLRVMIGETLEHTDGTDPINLYDLAGTFKTFARIGTFIVTLNDTEDAIVFPAQHKEVKLEKGSVLFFPPYWMYPHKSVHKGSGKRYSIQTWLVMETQYNVDSYLEFP